MVLNVLSISLSICARDVLKFFFGVFVWVLHEASLVLECWNQAKVFWFQCGDFTPPAAQVADGDIESVKFSSICCAQPETGVCHGLPAVVSRGDLR